MKQLKMHIVIMATAFILLSCAGHTPAPKKITDDGHPAALIDTTKLKGEITDVINSIANGKPDTNKLKAAGSDILKTDADVLSDSGISKLGDKNDPAAREAQNILIKMRNSMGITPGKLDSIRKAGEALGKGTQNH
jgi:hypothetical protein